MEPRQSRGSLMPIPRGRLLPASITDCSQGPHAELGAGVRPETDGPASALERLLVSGGLVCSGENGRS